MKFHKTLIQNKGFTPYINFALRLRRKHEDTRSCIMGFTLMEVLISLGIFIILLGVTTPFVLHFYKRYQLDAERATLIALLRQARTMSLTGEQGTNHGVRIASSQYTIFEGVSYAARDTEKDETFDRNTSVTLLGPDELVFLYLTGKSASQSFSLTNGTKQGYIYVNTEGRIDWE